MGPPGPDPAAAPLPRSPHPCPRSTCRRPCEVLRSPSHHRQSASPEPPTRPSCIAMQNDPLGVSAPTTEVVTATRVATRRRPPAPSGVRPQPHSPSMRTATLRRTNGRISRVDHHQMNVPGRTVGSGRPFIPATHRTRGSAWRSQPRTQPSCLSIGRQFCPGSSAATVVGAGSVATGTDRSVMGYGAYSWLSDQVGPSSPPTLGLT
ncbi:hypothetical protein GALL_324070 [mine drainage metagenome]|uniref:Uncharacterized protein n=1 Tax=mine drainage metagenome TaxID=410659 RepID=A0A1J5QQR6_9ZZZZ